MKIYRIMVALLIVAIGSFGILSSTLARYNSEYSGLDQVLVAKWNFRVGSTADNLQNQGFTFDVFNNQELSPQDMGLNSFVVSSGESDVAIEYQVFMNVDALLTDIYDAPEGTDYPPLIFYVSSSEATVTEPYDNWFKLNDVVADSEGYFQVASGQFDADFAGTHSITINWWWNTSFYVGTPNPDDSETGNYYAVALAIYEALVDDYNDKVDDANNFFSQHVRIVTTVDGVELVSYNCPRGDSCPYTLGAPGGDIDAAHMAEHARLLLEVDYALDAINNSLKCRYDAYDTRAISTMSELQTSAPEGILIKVVGNQIAPGQ